MTPLGAILWAKRRIARHTLASVRRESKLKVAFVSVSAVLLWLGVFQLARFGFRLFEDFGAEMLGSGGAALTLGDLVMARLLSVFALALFVMLVFSNVLVAFATLYRAREVTFLIQAPISTTTFFLGRFAECVTFSSWASAYLGSPILLAYGLESGAPAVFYLSLAGFYLPFVAIPAAIGASVAIALVRVFARLRRGPWAVLGLVTTLGVFAFFRGRLQAPDLADAATFQAILAAMGRTQSPFLPSHWLAQGVLGAATGETGEALFFFLLLLSTALMLTWAASLVAEAWFFAGWSALTGGGETRPAARRRGILGRLETLLRPLPEPTRSLTIKDLRLFWRDPAQWSQFVLFFGVMALYLANLRGLRAAGDAELWRALGTLLNLGACLLILASLTTRFIFPLVSLEGRRFWILGLAPVTMRQVVRQKVLLSVASTSIFTVGLAVLSAVQLELDRLSFAFSLLGVFAATAALSGLAVGLGSLYPSFGEDNPARIVSGLGGTLCFLLSMLYVALASAGQAVVLFRRDLARVLGEDALPWAVAGAGLWIAALTALACFLPLRLGLRHLERVEI